MARIDTTAISDITKCLVIEGPDDGRIGTQCYRLPRKGKMTCETHRNFERDVPADFVASAHEARKIAGAIYAKPRKKRSKIVRAMS